MPLRSCSVAGCLFLGLTAAPAAAAVSFPPPGSNAFIALYEIDSGQDACDLQCAIVASPTRNVVMAPATFTGPSPHFITAGGSVSPTAMRGFVTSHSSDAVQFDLAFRDTYTVVGGGADPFAVTARMTVTGTIGGVPFGAGGQFAASVANLSGRIGTFDINPAGLSPTVHAFSAPGSSNTVVAPTTIQASDFSIPVAFDVFHTWMVRPGDVFDAAYMVKAAYGIGEIDFQNTAAISFDTPDGVFLTAASGARFGDVPQAAIPEPSAWALMILGFGLGGAGLRSRRLRAA